MGDPLPQNETERSDPTAWLSDWLSRAVYALSLHYQVEKSPWAACRYWSTEPVRSLWQVLRDYHLPFWLLTLIALLISPWRWYATGELSLFDLIWPLALLVLPLILAIIVDRLCEHARGPQRIAADAFELKHLALFHHLPLSAAGLFFLIHPLTGFVAWLFALLWSLRNATLALSAAFTVTPARLMVRYLSTLLLFALPLPLLLFALNIYRSIEIWRDLGVL